MGAEQMETKGSEQQASNETPAVDLGKVRELILAANPNVVPEMIAGDSFDALLAAVEPAKAAYERIASGLSEQAAGNPGAATAGVGSGGAPGRTFVINVEELSPSAKIAEGLRQRRK